MKNFNKKLLAFAVSSIITTLSIYSQSGWFQTNTGTGYDYYSIHFTDNLTGWACGENGKIIKTINGGNSWFQQPSNVSAMLLSIRFQSVLSGAACGQNGTVITTSTGGLVWQQRASGTSNNLNSIFFISASTGWIAGDNGTILKTTNGGINWQSLSSGVSCNLKSICFTSAGEGWAVGSTGKIIKTTNGGNSWVISVDLGTITNLYSVSFVNPSTGYILGEYTSQNDKFIFFYKTINGGLWWLYQFSGVHTTLRSAFFIDENHGWAAGDSGVVLGTINGGYNWIGQPSHTTQNLNSVYFTSAKQGWISGVNGTVLKTITSGFFDTLNTNRRDLGVVPMVTNSGLLLNAKYRVMFGPIDTGYSILRSLNNWISHDTLFSHLSLSDTGKAFNGLLVRVQKIKFNVYSGFYNGNAGVVKDPVDSSQVIQTRRYGWDYFPPQNKYLEGSKFLLSYNRPWQSKSMSLSYPARSTYIGFRSLLSPEDLRKVKIVFKGYGNGQMAYRYLAVDSVHYMYQDMREVPVKVFEAEEYDGTPQLRQLNCGFLEYPSGSLNMKWEPTADSLGGKEVLYIFNSNYNPSPDTFYTNKNLLLQQAWVDVMYVWAPKLISQGMNYHVNDEFWIYPYTVTRPEIAPGYPLFYEFETSAYIGVQQISTEVPVKFSLSQNYPNPFNPVTKIKFEIPKTGVLYTTGIQIKVYDILGREVQTLVNESLRPGIYETEFNGDNFSSGVYFYVFRAGDYSESKKMILLK